MIEILASVLKALGEPTRLKIIRLLAERELCVCELEALLDMSQPRVSQHLKVLRNAGVVRERKERQKSFFSLDVSFADGRVPGFADLMATGMENIPDLELERNRFPRLESEEIRNCRNGTARKRKFGGNCSHGDSL